MNKISFLLYTSFFSRKEYIDDFGVYIDEYLICNLKKEQRVNRK